MPKKQKINKKDQQSNFRIIAEAVILAMLVRSFLFEPFYIPSGSMKSGLMEGDFIIVSKFTYGFSKYSFPFGVVPIKERIFASKPDRGEVIIFRLPTNPKINYVKRLIGMPGDKIQLINGELYINEKIVAKQENGYFKDSNSDMIPQYKEILPNGKSYNILDKLVNSSVDNTPIYEVPEGYYFFLGDNRDNSQDSRFTDKVGFVAERNIVGKAKYIFMSSNASLLKFWLWHKNIRFNRIFTKVE